MVKVLTKQLPNGVVPFESISNSDVKRAVMLLNNNIVSLKKQLDNVSAAVVELQRNGGKHD